MGEIVVLAKLVQCLRSAGNDAAGDACLHVGEAIEAFAAHHRVGETRSLRIRCSVRVLIFSRSASSSLVSQISGACCGRASFLKT